MKDHEGCKRGFYRSSKAWYAEAVGGEPTINIGMYADEGGTSGEMSVVWVSLSNKLVPQLRAFDDSWSSLSLFPELISAMAEVDDKNVTEQEFVDILLACGFEDQTEYNDPDKDNPRTAKVRRIRELQDEIKGIRDSL